MKHLDDLVTVLPKVGPKRAEALAGLGIHTVEDILTYYPFRYEDMQPKELSEIGDQSQVVLQGIVVSPPMLTRFGPKKSRLNFRMKIEEAVIAVTFFNQPFLKNNIVMEEPIAVYGRWDAVRKSLVGMRIITDKKKGNEFNPVYHVNKSIRKTTLVQLIHEAIESYSPLIRENLPQLLLNKYQLMPRKEAIIAMHEPENLAMYEKAKQRLTYEEFFLFEMRMKGLQHRIKTSTPGRAILYDNQALKAFIHQLPFELTDAQKKVTNAICRDLRLPHPMNRLLQGDVGSGKTVVAALAMFATATAGIQSALMVPTEILAEQHYRSLQELFARTPYKVALLIGSTSKVEREAIYAGLADGTISMVVGTHALIQDNVEFKALGLAVIDEQHRFGVKQRQTLREKGEAVDVLAMTATPIPRTLAITAYGEMDVSVIDEMPKGRKPIETKWLRRKQFEQALDWAKPHLQRGEQMYVICPLIEESEALDVKNAEAVFQEVRTHYHDEFEVGLMHGRLPSEEKEQLMGRFECNKCQIMVSTTVIEVGVNVPNATMMLIVDADRFGLAQLHQLRGRVGRGVLQSYCMLIADPKSEVGEERMKIMTETNDGFVLSQKDLEMRGPGEFFGNRQSGMPQFKVGDMLGDQLILEAATADASEMWQTEWYNDPENKELVRLLQENNQHYFD